MVQCSRACVARGACKGGRYRDLASQLTSILKTSLEEWADGAINNFSIHGVIGGLICGVGACMLAVTGHRVERLYYTLNIACKTHLLSHPATVMLSTAPDDFHTWSSPFSLHSSSLRHVPDWMPQPISCERPG